MQILQSCRLGQHRSLPTPVVSTVEFAPFVSSSSSSSSSSISSGAIVNTVPSSLSSVSQQSRHTGLSPIPSNALNRNSVTSPYSPIKLHPITNSSQHNSNNNNNNNNNNDSSDLKSTYQRVFDVIKNILRRDESRFLDSSDGLVVYIVTKPETSRFVYLLFVICYLLFVYLFYFIINY